ncbi:MAG TPA: hypothetical protein VK859_06305, partial [bacterium]|nr:hypothetical protein [bacterium]
GRGFDLGLLDVLNRAATGGLKPDLTLLFDIPVEIGLKRAAGRGKGKDRMEKEKVRFHRKVRQVFLKIAKKEKRRFIVLDGRQGVQEVYRKVLYELNERLPGSNRALKFEWLKGKHHG